MPYSSEKKGVLLPRDKDRRVKLTEDDKNQIRHLYKEEGKSIHSIARIFEKICSRRMIQMVLFPERYEKMKEQFKQRRKDGRYKPSKEKWAKTMREHRRYKHSVITELKEKEKVDINSLIQK